MLRLCDNGHQVTCASANKPPIEFLEKKNFYWLHTPTWSSNYGWGLIRLLFFSTIVFIKKPVLLFRFLKAANNSNTFANRIKIINRHIPYFLNSWEVIYFPWNSASIELHFLFNFPSATVVSCRGSQIMVAPHNPLRNSIKRGLQKSFQQADIIHCVSNSILKEATKYGLLPEKAKVVRPAVRTTFFHPIKNTIREKKLKIISVSHINWVKGLEYALLAVEIAIQNKIPIEYTIIGDGPEQERLLFNIYDLNLSDHVKYIGAMPQQKVREQLYQSNIMLLPSLSEGISNAALEAMACGNVVISTICGGMPEVINHNENGILVPLRDPASMAEEIGKIWKQPQTLSRISQNAIQTIQNQFNFEQQVQKFENIFEEAITLKKHKKSKIA